MVASFRSMRLRSRVLGDGLEARQFFSLSKSLPFRGKWFLNRVVVILTSLIGVETRSSTIGRQLDGGKKGIAAELRSGKVNLRGQPQTTGMSLTVRTARDMKPTIAVKATRNIGR